jgi:hypothetical protein
VPGNGVEAGTSQGAASAGFQEGMDGLIPHASLLPAALSPPAPPISDGVMPNRHPAPNSTLYNFAAIDSIIDRGGLDDWIQLRATELANPEGVGRPAPRIRLPTRRRGTRSRRRLQAGPRERISLDTIASGEIDLRGRSKLYRPAPEVSALAIVQMGWEPADDHDLRFFIPEKVKPKAETPIARIASF